MKLSWNKENMQTYLLLRNGERVYRIASEVDFSPRLIPLADEFNDAFTVTGRDGWRMGLHLGFDDSTTVGPKDFAYDAVTDRLRTKLKHYNRIVVLIQGLLDRSEVYHPHPPINLAHEEDINSWLNLVRDEENALGAGSYVETWEQYRDRLNGWLTKGDTIYTRYYAGRRRSYRMEGPPTVMQVGRVRLGTKADIITDWYEGTKWHGGRPASECVGLPGVEVSWDGGTHTMYPRDRWRASYEKQMTGHMWIPISRVFNMNQYQLGDYKKFLCDRTQKGAYLKWAGPLLTAEDWKREQHDKTKKA